MSRVRICYGERASFGGELGRHVNPPINVVVNHAVVVVPEDVKRKLRTLDHAALKLKAGTRLQVLLRRAGYLSSCLCKQNDTRVISDG